MKIRMISQTRWNGVVRRPGDTTEIDSNTALRWIKNGIAEPVEPGKTEPAEAGKTEETASTELEGLNYNEIRKIAKGKNITIPKGTKKPELIALLRQPEKSSAEPTGKPAEEKKTD